MITSNYFGFFPPFFLTNSSRQCVNIRRMKLPQLSSRTKSPEQLSKKDEEVFAEAKELASLRLEQCLADLRIFVPAIQHGPRHPLKKISL